MNLADGELEGDLIDNAEYWPLFDSPICGRILAAPAYSFPLIWEDKMPDLSGYILRVCKACAIESTDTECFICGGRLMAKPLEWNALSGGWQPSDADLTGQTVDPIYYD